MTEQDAQKVTVEASPTGSMGQRYLAAGRAVSLRLWEEHTADGAKPQVARDYETVGYVIGGQARLHVGDDVLTLGPGDSWVVPQGVEHTYEILAPLTAVEATAPPAQAHARDETPA